MNNFAIQSLIVIPGPVFWASCFAKSVLENKSWECYQ